MSESVRCRLTEITLGDNPSPGRYVLHEGVCGSYDHPCIDLLIELDSQSAASHSD
jgi:hypothetical protein